MLRSRVQATLIMTCFPKETDELERKIRKGLHAARAVVSSSSIPVFLEGVLLLGNYVNSSSQTLGSATGVALDSITKLAHTRALESESEANNRSFVQKPKNALILLVDHLQKTQEPTWLKTLIYELECCREACDLDISTTGSGVKDLLAKLKVVEECFKPIQGFNENESPASIEARVKRFMAYATPRLEMLRNLETDLQAATGTVRKYFAEPHSTSLTHMLRSLASLLDLLPRENAFSPRGLHSNSPRGLHSNSPRGNDSKSPRGNQAIVAQAETLEMQEEQAQSSQQPNLEMLRHSAPDAAQVSSDPNCDQQSGTSTSTSSLTSTSERQIV